MQEKKLKLEVPQSNINLKKTIKNIIKAFCLSLSQTCTRDLLFWCLIEDLPGNISRSVTVSQLFNDSQFNMNVMCETTVGPYKLQLNIGCILLFPAFSFSISFLNKILFF